jgi:hypothetical protein
MDLRLKKVDAAPRLRRRVGYAAGQNRERASMVRERDIAEMTPAKCRAARGLIHMMTNVL